MEEKKPWWIAKVENQTPKIQCWEMIGDECRVGTVIPRSPRRRRFFPKLGITSNLYWDNFSKT